MKRLILALICALAACTDQGRSSRVLREAGFEQIEFTGYEFFDCSDDDDFHTGFVARNAKGERVEGTVCCGLFGTARFASSDFRRVR